ncbi:MAG: response regulator [Chitinophagaceae bacterium]|nr:response regulator [Chitinophagaceae bacterium]
MQAKILLVDDEADLLVLMKAKLTRQGHAVITSLNGEHLLDSVIRTKPDLILMDITMKGVDGGTCCYLLKTSNCTQHIPVILFSGNTNLQSIGALCKADGILAKPYDAMAFQQMLERFIA